MDCRERRLPSPPQREPQIASILYESETPIRVAPFPSGQGVNGASWAWNRRLAFGLAGLLLTTEPEVRYFSGIHTQFWQSPTRSWFLFVPSSGKPIASIPEIGAALMRQTCQ